MKRDLDSLSTDEAWELWMAELRKPESQRAHGVLEEFYSGGRCCLGHACAALIPWTRQISEDETVFYDGSSIRLPPALAEKLDILDDGNFSAALSQDEVKSVAGLKSLGLTNKNNNDPFGSAAILNDSTNLTPQQMADVLEWARREGRFTRQSGFPVSPAK